MTLIGFLFFAIIWVVLIPSSQQLSTECCPPDTVWTNKGNCTDGHKIRLNCKFYIADPKKHSSDAFTINETSSSLHFLQWDQPVPYEEFCTVTNGTRQIALVCFKDEDIEEENHWRLNLLGTVFIISSCFLILTLAIYAYLPELRDIQDKSMMCVMISLAVGYLMLAFTNFNFYGPAFEFLCIPTAFIVYYAFLTAFFWFNIVSFNIWRCVWFKKFVVNDRNLFAIFCVIGWGIPTCFLIAALTTHHVDGSHLKPGFSRDKCWFPGGKEIWVYFLGPLTILLVSNVVYLSMTSWRLWQHSTESNPSKIRTLKTKCILYIKLVFVMGVTWIFEIVSSIDGVESDIIWLPMDILNALQGFIIFLLLVINRTKVRILLARRRPCGISLSKTWATQVDEESEHVCMEEMELSSS